MKNSVIKIGTVHSRHLKLLIMALLQDQGMTLLGKPLKEWGTRKTTMSL